MAPAPQTVLALSSSPLPSLPSISLLPFSLAHDGPAPISTYFRPRPYPSTSEAEPAHRQASFRGRRVVSTVLSLPEGYQGLVFSTSAPLPPTAAQDEVDEASQEREERAAKRAKRAAASAAALATSALEEDEGDSAAADGLRRSPRKGTAVSTAAARARERAVRAAKEKAKQAAAAKGKNKGGFSLDSDEEEQATEQQEEQEMAAVEVQETQVVEISETEVKTDAGTLEVTSAEETTTIEVVAAPPPAPLRTTSALSTASASQIPSTPLSTTASFSSLNPFDAPVALARDEKHLRPCATFDTIEVWNPDWPVAGGRVAEEDAVGKTVSEWMRLASKIHSY
ncbi:hypothetical protein NBRC10512v2_007493 [Rhodotorula toruloides]|uniref:RHTO0S12e05028g1_1 n=2 Tax=Rhodotorula toruloides TaxID=5286 RepID=A0A061B990_RHOTO|nr:ribonuclease H2, subunit C [Rhodotorula toruloides NP11]EMS23118.1 ribonuclease H2, subunit C [Rhodotorula toruloides NP11]CDR46485.1 RHTO0S12e05028g1_1 [Rhodotorula toruloides]